MQRQSAGLRALADRSEDVARRRPCATSARSRARHGDAGSRDARPGRRPVDRPSRGRACGEPGRRRPGPSVHPEHGRLAHDRGGGRGDGGGAAAGISSTGRKDRDLAASFVAPCRAGRLRRDRRDARHLAARLAPARPRPCLPALPQRARGSPTTSHDPVFRAALERPPEEDPGPAIGHWADQFANPSVTWSDLRLAARADRAADRAEGHPSRQDAPRAVQEGVDGLIVSNHGGRQVDGAIGALDALPGSARRSAASFRFCSTAASARAPTCFKALALGADAVCLGRPYVWGLGAGRPGRVSSRCCAACWPSWI